MPKVKSPPRSANEVRKIILNYFYQRNKNAKSRRSDKTGAAVKISVVCRELKGSHELSKSEVQSNLTYLMSQKWIEPENIEKSFPLPNGTVVHPTTTYYKITADGIDKIEGTGEFTMPKFQGVNIHATGQNIITLGDNNQVDARFESIGTKLIEFKDAVRSAADINDSVKLSVIADVDSIESQLAKPEPNRSVIQTIWSGIEKLTTGTSLARNLFSLGQQLSSLMA